MLWDTRKAVQHSLLEFTPALRAKHHIVKLASGKWTRTLGPPGDTEKYRVVNVRGREWKQVPRVASADEREWWQTGPVHHATKKKSPAQLDREIASALVHSERGDRVLADLTRWGIDRTLLDEVRQAFRAGNHRRAMELARDLGWNRAAKRGRGGLYQGVASPRTGPKRAHSTKKQSDNVGVGDEVYAVSGGRRHGPGIVEEIYGDGTMRVDFTRQFAGRLRVRPQDLIEVPSK